MVYERMSAMTWHIYICHVIAWHPRTGCGGQYRERDGAKSRPRPSGRCIGDQFTNYSQNGNFLAVAIRGNTEERSQWACS
jgi:hypothetical protein